MPREAGGLARGRPSRYRGTRQQEDEVTMNEDVFNMEIRKFLKLVGVTSQREIEEAVRAAVKAGKLKGSETLKVRVQLTLDGAGLSKTIDGQIALG